MKKMNKKGFTLAELLIVVAIIAVLVAIAIPVFNTQLEKSREGVDAANIRAAYAEVITARMAGSSEYYKEVSIRQKTAGWVTAFDFPANLYISAANDADTLKTDVAKGSGASFKPADADGSVKTIYVVSNGEGKAYVSTSAPTGDPAPTKITD